MDVLEPVIAVGPAAIYAVLFVIVFAESAAWLGLVVPGDVALVAAGALTTTGEVGVPGVLAVALAGTVAGYAVAYAIGRRAGPRILASAQSRPRLAGALPTAWRLLDERGILLVVASRWVGVLCAVVPVAAGASGFPRRRFAVAQVAGGAIWVLGVTLLGRSAAAGVGAEGDLRLLWVSVAVAVVVSSATWLAWRRIAGRPVPARTLWAVVGGAVGVATVVVLLRIAGTDAVVAALGRIDGKALLAVVALEVAALATLTQVYRSVHAANGGRLRYREAVSVCLGAFGLTQLLPGGGAAGGLYAMRRLRAHGADPVRATTTVVLVGLVTLGTLGMMLSVATSLAALVAPGYVGVAAASAAVTAVIVATLGVVRRLTVDGPARRRTVARLERLRWRGRAVAAPWARRLADHEGLLDRPTRLLRPAGWSAVNWSLDISVLAVTLVAVGARVPLLGVLVAFALGNLLNALPLTPGGVGVVEVGLAGALIGFGGDPAAVTIGLVAYRVIAFWIPTAFAAPVVVAGLRMGPVVVGPGPGRGG